MLIKFSVSNYLSFKDTMTLSMIKGRVNNHDNHIKTTNEIDLIRSAAVFGKNGAGKSNLIKAIRMMKKMVLGEMPPINSYYRPDKECQNKETCFEVELEIEGKYYSYGYTVSIDKQRILDEWLYELSSVDGNRNIFQRKNLELTDQYDNKEKELITLLKRLIKDNKLFLSIIGEMIPDDGNALRDIKKVYSWFAKKLLVIDTDLPFIPTNLFTKDGFDKINEIMSLIDTGVNTIGYERSVELTNNVKGKTAEDLLKRFTESQSTVAGVRETDGRYLSVKDYRVSVSDDNNLVFDEIVYKHNDIVFHSDEESDGTRKLYGLVASFLSEEKDITFVIDELDSRLHPDLTIFVVNMFLNIQSCKDSQFIFTTHADTIMEKNILRRDEIWFMEKNSQGESELYSLEDFREKTERRIRKAYREGRYGAIPQLSENIVV